MSRAVEHEKGISRQRLMQMLGRRRPEPIDVNTKGAQAPLFDWRCPHRYEPMAWLLMKNLGKKIAAYIEKSLSLVSLNEPKVVFKRIVQEFANVLADNAMRQEKAQYFMPLQVGAKTSDGFINFQFEAATVLVSQLLRDPESAVASSGQLSTLEESILQDGAIVIADAVILALQEHGDLSVQHADRLVKGDWPLPVHQLQDLCGFCFTITYPKQTVDITLLFVGESLDPAVGIKRTQKALNQAELSRLIVRQLYNVPVDITAQLCVTSVRMDDLMQLEAGDVLVLNKKIDEPADVYLNERVCFQAWPVQCEGKQALKIASNKKL